MAEQTPQAEEAGTETWKLALTSDRAGMTRGVTTWALLLDGAGLLGCWAPTSLLKGVGDEECPASAGVAGGGAFALLLAGAACLLYARTRRKMLWSETAGKRPLGQHPSGAPRQLQTNAHAVFTR